MSASNAAAKKRRAIIPPNAAESFPNVGGRSYIPPKSQIPPPPSTQDNSNMGSSQPGFTLQQVISLIDTRLVSLEKNVTELNKKQSAETTGGQASSNSPVISSQLKVVQEHISEQTKFNTQIQENFQTVNENMNEYDSRFEILVNEIAEIKFIVLKLQTYTMDVNKMLLQERQSVDSVVAGTNTVVEKSGEIGKDPDARFLLYSGEGHHMNVTSTDINSTHTEVNDATNNDNVDHDTEKFLYTGERVEEARMSFEAPKNEEVKYTLSSSSMVENRD